MSHCSSCQSLVRQTRSKIGQHGEPLKFNLRNSRLIINYQTSVFEQTGKMRNTTSQQRRRVMKQRKKEENSSMEESKLFPLWPSLFLPFLPTVKLTTNLTTAWPIRNKQSKHKRQIKSLRFIFGTVDKILGI